MNDRARADAREELTKAGRDIDLGQFESAKERCEHASGLLDELIDEGGADDE